MDSTPTKHSPRQPQQSQSSLQSLFIVLGFTGVILALVTNLRHVGVTAACFVLGMSIGGYLRKWQAFFASLTALLVFVISYLTLWVQIGYGPFMQGYYWDKFWMDRTSEVLSEYAKTKGEYPDSLQPLAQIEAKWLPFDDSGQLLDQWHHPYYYQRTANGFELATLGRDGKLGGVGLDADIFLGESLSNPKTHLPMSQFLFETQASGNVFFAALFASVAAGGIWLTARKEAWIYRRGLIVGIVVITIAAVLFAGALAVVYIATSQSGH